VDWIVASAPIDPETSMTTQMSEGIRPPASAAGFGGVTFRRTGTSSAAPPAAPVNRPSCISPAAAIAGVDEVALCFETGEVLSTKAVARMRKSAARQNFTLFGLRKAAYSKRLFADNLEFIAMVACHKGPKTHSPKLASEDRLALTLEESRQHRAPDAELHDVLARTQEGHAWMFQP